MSTFIKDYDPPTYLCVLCPIEYDGICGLTDEHIHHSIPKWCPLEKFDENVLKREAKKMGYILMPDKKYKKFLPCICGCNRRDHWYRYDPKKGETVTLKCQKCGKEVIGKSDADAKEKWNEEMRKCLQIKE